MLDRLNASLSFYQNALDLRAQRQEVLASNIANNDTPNYRARDFDFTKALDAAIGQAGANSGLAMQTSSAGHLGGSAGAGGRALSTVERAATQPSQDGNTVDMDVERLAFMENAVHYRANLQILGSQIQGLRAAMQPER